MSGEFIQCPHEMGRATCIGSCNCPCEPCAPSRPKTVAEHTGEQVAPWLLLLSQHMPVPVLDDAGWPDGVMCSCGSALYVGHLPGLIVDRIEVEETRWRRRALFAEEAIRRAMRLYHEAIRAGLTLQPTAVRDALAPQTIEASEPLSRPGQTT